MSLSYHCAKAIKVAPETNNSKQAVCLWLYCKKDKALFLSCLWIAGFNKNLTFHNCSLTCRVITGLCSVFKTVQKIKVDVILAFFFRMAPAMIFHSVKIFDLKE